MVMVKREIHSAHTTTHARTCTRAHACTNTLEKKKHAYTYEQAKDRDSIKHAEKHTRTMKNTLLHRSGHTTTTSHDFISVVYTSSQAPFIRRDAFTHSQTVECS